MTQLQQQHRQQSCQQAKQMPQWSTLVGKTVFAQVRCPGGGRIEVAYLAFICLSRRTLFFEARISIERTLLRTMNTRAHTQTQINKQTNAQFGRFPFAVGTDECVQGGTDYRGEESKGSKRQ
jgi:hypothetical protein